MPFGTRSIRSSADRKDLMSQATAPRRSSSAVEELGASRWKAQDGLLLELDDLRVEFRTREGVARAINGVSFSLHEGETVAVLGESGSGKSVTAQAIMGILDSPPGFITGGEIRYCGENILAMPETERRGLRGPEISMVFQDALSSLNPVFPVGWQIAEMFRKHRRMNKTDALNQAVRLMERVQIPGARQRVKAYPHQFSGGMRQRIMIAMAISLDPAVLIADEPTTALDVTVQAQIMRLLKELQEERKMGLILITHDLGVVADVADQIAVMYAGRIVERASTERIFRSPEHPYTWGLLRSIPRLDVPREAPLVPIPGRPPSLINPPSGCSFHPRCPYVRESHKRVDPTLEPVPGERDHAAACLLPSEIRKRIWAELREGKDPAEVREHVRLEELEEKPA